MHKRTFVDVGDSETIADRYRKHRDQFSRVATHNRTAKDNPRGGIRNYLHKAAGIIVDLGFGRRSKRNFGHTDLTTFGECVCFGESDVGDFGFSENRRSSLVVVR